MRLLTAGLQVRVLPVEQMPNVQIGHFYFKEISMAHYVYILQSQSHDKYYTGESQDPEERLECHNTIEKGFISRYRPWKIVYKRKCSDRIEALRLEKKIKSWKSKIMVKRLITSEIEI